MHCPFCQKSDTRVLDSRVSEDGAAIRRRRSCNACSGRFSTLETIELKLPSIVKRDKRREPLSIHKLRAGFETALHKRPVTNESVELAVHSVMERLRKLGEREVDSIRVGEFVMEELRKLDDVGYVRFASVYREFQDKEDFCKEVECLKQELARKCARDSAANS